MNFVRPVVLMRFRFRVAAVKDELNMLLLSGRILPTNEEFRIVRRRANDLENDLPYINLTNMLMAWRNGQMRSFQQVKTEQASIQSGNLEVKRLSDSLDVAIIGSFSANSPLLVGIAVILIIGFAMFFAFARSVQTSATNFFWSSISLPKSVSISGSNHAVA